MARNNTYFYLSGVIAFSLFTLFFALFLVFLFQNSKIKTYALNKNTFISISLDSIPTKNISTKKRVQKSVVKTTPAQEVQNVDVNDLFSDVWTKKIKTKKTKTVKHDKRIIDEIRKQIKISDIKNTEPISKNLESLDKNDKNTKETSSSSGNEVNEYLAKIQAIVYKYFHVPANSQGHSVKALIELNALGKVLDFRILNYSSNAALNAEVDKIKRRLQNVVFPRNPSNKSSRTIVILKSKE
jgi:protein TonB